MEQLGKYSIKKKLGEGGFGAVYLAEDNIGREVALKVLHPQISDDEMLLGYFRREAVALGRLSHPNIILIHSFEEEGDKTYIVMEYVDGPTLSKVLRQGLMPLDDTLAIFVQVLRALGHAHAKGVVHRDIKPGNIMLTSEGQVKIADFGIARVTGTEKLTKTGTGAGSLLYMSPEQIKGKDIDQRSDIYSLGATLYQMLTGSTPFQGDSDYDIMTKQLNDPPPPMRNLRRDLPPALEEIVSKALAKRKEDRYQSAEEMAQALEALRASGKVKEVEVDLSERTRLTISDMRRTQETILAKTPQGGGRKGLIYILGGVILVAVVVLAFVLWPKGSPGPVETNVVKTDTTSTDTTKQVASETYSDSLKQLGFTFASGAYRQSLKVAQNLLGSANTLQRDNRILRQIVASSKLMLGDQQAAEKDLASLKSDYPDLDFSASQFPERVRTAWAALNSPPAAQPVVTVTIEKWDLFDRLTVELDGKSERYSGKPLQFTVAKPNRRYEMQLKTESDMFTDTVNVGDQNRSKVIKLEAIEADVKVTAKYAADPLGVVGEVYVDGQLVENPDGSPRNTPCDISLMEGPHKIAVKCEGYKVTPTEQYVNLTGSTKVDFELHAR